MSEDQTLPVIRCSSLPRLALCPGSMAACIGIKGDESAQAEAGTKAHKVLEDYYNAKANSKEYDLEASGLEPMYLARAKLYVQAVNALIEEHGGENVILTEVEIIEYISSFSLSGHADLIVECKDGVTIIADWKFNFLEVVSASGNIQLMGYVVLWYERNLVKSIIAVLAAGGNEKPITGTQYDCPDIVAARNHIERICNAALDVKAPRIPGLEQCRYCPAKATQRCPESSEDVLQTACGLELIPSSSCLPAERDQIVRIYNAIKQVESFGKKFMDMLKDAVETNPEAYAGFFELKNTGSTRTITDAQEAYRRIVGGGLLDAQTFLGLVDLPIGKLESALKETLKEQGIRVGEHKAHIEGLLSGVIEYKEKAKSIKAVS